MKILIQSVLTTLLCVSYTSGGDTWPQFRGPTGDGISLSDLPTEWSEEKNVDWKIEIEGIAWSQPIVWQQNVYLTTAIASEQTEPVKGDTHPGFSLFSGGGLSRVIDGGKPADIDVEWQLICLDLKTGDRRWEKVVHQGPPAIAIHRSNSYASETPMTDGKHVFVHLGMVGLWCFDTEGNEVWNKPLPTHPMMFGWGSGGSTILDEDSIFLVCDNEKDSFLVAFDKRTGDERWKVEREEASNWSTPYLWKNKLRSELVICGGRATRSYDPKSGEALWSIPANGRCSTTAVGNQDLVIVGSQARTTGKGGTLIAVKSGAAGEIKLDDDFVAWQLRKKSPELSSPLLMGDYVYTLSQHAGAIHCFDATTGDLHYRKRLPKAGVFTASPWTEGNNVYCLDGKGNTFVIEPGTELKLKNTNKLNGMFWSSPALVDDAVLLRSVNHLYRISNKK